MLNRILISLTVAALMLLGAMATVSAADDASGAVAAATELEAPAITAAPHEAEFALGSPLQPAVYTSAASYGFGSGEPEAAPYHTRARCYSWGCVVCFGAMVGSEAFVRCFAIVF